MLAGFARQTINPTIPCIMEGLGQKKPAASVHDDLYVRAVMVCQGDTRLLILGFDLLFLDTARWQRLEKRLQEALDLRPEEVLVNMSHTHAGPRVSRWAYGNLPDAAYLDRVEQRALAVALQAKERCVPVTAEAGEGSAAIPLSRRRLDDTGYAQWLPAEEEPVCEAIPFLCLRDAKQHVVALLFSVSCHPSMIYSDAISADYPGAAMQELNHRYQTEGALFLQGAGGDTKPRTLVREDKWCAGTWDDVAAVGRLTAEAIGTALDAGGRSVPPKMRLARTTVDLPLTSPLPDAATLEAVLYNPEERLERRLWASEMFYRLTLTGALPSAVPVEIHVVSFGGVFRIVGVQGELVGELGNLIRASFDDGITLALGYTHGVQIYIPSDRQLPQGGYEVESYWEYHWPAPLAQGIDGRLAAAVARLRDQLA